MSASSAKVPLQAPGRPSPALTTRTHDRRRCPRSRTQPATHTQHKRNERGLAPHLQERGPTHAHHKQQEQGFTPHLQERGNTRATPSSRDGRQGTVTQAQPREGEGTGGRNSDANTATGWGRQGKDGARRAMTLARATERTKGSTTPTDQQHERQHDTHLYEKRDKEHSEHAENHAREIVGARTT